MPLFEYRCPQCNTRFEKLVRSSTAVATAGCPQCGKEELEPELSTFAARSSSPASAPAMGGCPSGMCQNPGLCGRN